MIKIIFSFIVIINCFAAPMSWQVRNLVSDIESETELKLQKPERFAEQYYLTLNPIFRSRDIEFSRSGQNGVLESSTGNGMEATISGFTRSDYFGHVSAYVKFGYYFEKFAQTGSTVDVSDLESQAFDFQSVFLFGRKWRFGSGFGFKRKGVLEEQATNIMFYKQFNIPYMTLITNYQNKLNSRFYYKIELDLELEPSKTLSATEEAEAAINYGIEGKLATKYQEQIYSFSLGYNHSSMSTNIINSSKDELTMNLGISFPL